MEEFEGAEWVLISDEVPLDEQQRDELLEAFQVQLHGGAAEEEDDEDVDTTTSLRPTTRSRAASSRRSRRG